MIEFNILIPIVQLFHNSFSDHEPFPELLFAHIFDVSHYVAVFEKALGGDCVSEFTESALHVGVVPDQRLEKRRLRLYW